MLIKRYLLTLFLIAATLATKAQVSGLVKSSSGEPLAFASIYVQGTTNGTTSNMDGFYTFNLPKGNHQLVFQYVGFQQKVINVEIGDDPVQKDVVLEDQSVKLEEVVVRANAEDPAYPVIRKAIAKRKYYNSLVKSSSCDAYVKGIQKILDAPEKILGQKVGTMNGQLDSSRQGIVYLSESKAKLYKAQPDKLKEVMYLSKVSGNDNGFGFNRASLMDFNFYKNHINIERDILSPIANNAFQYYRYKLEGIFQDENGFWINKIKVIKKRASDPVVSGYIYIVEDLWNIQSLELHVTGEAIKQPVLDTLTIRQVHIPVQSPDIWMEMSQSVSFKFGLMGFKISGQFTGIFSNYKVNENFPKNFFTQETFKVEDGANSQSLSVWDTIRPIPLTSQEKLDYVKKDSLQIVWNSKKYKDSIDREDNKFKFMDLLTGYTYRNTYQRSYISIASPLTTVLYNPVQGFYGKLKLAYTKRFDNYNMRYFKVNSHVAYGFSDKKLRGKVGFLYNFNATHFTQLRIDGGVMTSQYNQDNPISPMFNSLSALMAHKNYANLYQKKFAKVGVKHEIINGLYFQGNLEYSERNLLFNHSNYSLFNRKRNYLPNNSVVTSRTDLPDLFGKHQAFILNAKLRIRFKQQYSSYPGRKYISDSKYPDIWINYTKGIKALGSDVDFDKIWVNIEHNFSLGLVGQSEFHLEAGTFLNRKQIPFMDYQHFFGNQILFVNGKNDNQRFLTLPYYEKSTSDRWLQAHYAHNFNGYILDKIPLINRLGWKIEVGGSILYQPNKNTASDNAYTEIRFGLTNIGIKAFRMLSTHLAVSYDESKHRNTRFIVKIAM